MAGKRPFHRRRPARHLSPQTRTRVSWRGRAVREDPPPRTGSIKPLTSASFSAGPGSSRTSQRDRPVITPQGVIAAHPGASPSPAPPTRVGSPPAKPPSRRVRRQGR